MGKTAVFVLATLQQLVPVEGQVDTLVLCHTRELAYQICQEYLRFSKYLPDVKVKVFFGGIPVAQHRKLLETETPNIVVGTPGRILQLMQEKKLKLDHLKRFILDECDQMLEKLDMRKDVQAIFKATPHEKQVMMFSATLAKEIRPVCRKFTQHVSSGAHTHSASSHSRLLGAAIRPVRAAFQALPDLSSHYHGMASHPVPSPSPLVQPIEIYVDDESKLTLHGLQQYYVKLTEAQKNRKLNDLLDALDFNQVVIFVNGVRRAKELNKLLNECNFPSMAIYGGLEQEERLDRYNKFKEYHTNTLHLHLPSPAPVLPLLSLTRVSASLSPQVQVPHSGVDGHLRSRRGLRARQHRLQLRHAGERGPVPAPRGQERQVRHEGAGHHLRQQRGGQRHPRAGAEPLRGRDHRAARADRRQHLHERVRGRAVGGKGRTPARRLGGGGALGGCRAGIGLGLGEKEK